MVLHLLAAVTAISGLNDADQERYKPFALKHANVHRQLSRKHDDGQGLEVSLGGLL